MKNISKIISSFFLSISIIILLYIVYRSEFYHGGTSLSYYLKYYFIAFLLIALSIISFFLGKELKTKILLVLISTVFALYLIEGYLVINNIDPHNQPWITIARIEQTKKLDIKFDNRSIFKVYNNFKKKKESNIAVFNAGHSFHQNGDEIYKFGSISNKKTLIPCNENGYYPIFQSDRYGFNNPDEEWNKKEIEFLLVGDSYTHGYCVNGSETMSANLRLLLANEKKGVINLGQGDAGPLIAFATLREYLHLINPKRIIWVFTGENDIDNFNRELSTNILLKYFNNDKFNQSLYLKQDEIDKLLTDSFLRSYGDFNKRFLKLYNSRVYFILFINKLLKKDTSKNVFFESNKFIELSSKFKKIVEDKGAKLYFVYMPGYASIEKYKYANILGNNYNYFERSLKLSSRELKYHQEVIKIIKDLNISIIDLDEEIFKKHEDILSLYPFRLPGHLNKSGYKVVAKTIFDKIKNYENLQ